MVEPVNPKLLQAVLERDAERERRIHFQRAAGALKLRCEKLQQQVRQLTLDKAVQTARRPAERA